MKDHTHLIVLLSFGLLGAVALVAGSLWGIQRYSLYQDGVRTEGQVIEIIESTETIEARDDQGRVIKRQFRNVQKFIPVIAYTGPDDRKFRLNGPARYEEPGYAVGASVPLMYDPQDPYEAQLDDPWEIWTGPVVIVGAGLLLLALTAIVVIAPFTPKEAFRQRDRQGRNAAVDNIRVTAIVSAIRALDGAQEDKYVVVAHAIRPGARAQEEFFSGPFSFKPAQELIGRRVNLRFDLNKPGSYQLEVESLLLDLMERQATRQNMP